MSVFKEAESAARHQATRNIADEIMRSVHEHHLGGPQGRRSAEAAWGCSNDECQRTQARLFEMLRRCQK